MDKLAREVLNYIREEKLILPGDRVVIGLSGGADSTALTAVLSELRAIIGAEFIAVHVNHGLRGAEGLSDAEAARKTAARLKVDFYLREVDTLSYAEKGRLSLEEAARELRYGALRDAGREVYGSPFSIAVAHHSLDQAETILFNILRGSGLMGAVGIRARRDDIIRPFLRTEKQDILDYLERRELSFVTDSSNLSLDFARNRIRNLILPKLRDINQKAASHITALSERIEEIDSHMRKEAADYMAEYSLAAPGSVRLNAPVLKEKDAALRLYVIIESLRSLNVPLKDWGERHFRDIDKLMSLPEGKYIDLPGKVRAGNLAGDTYIEITDYREESDGV